RDVEGLGLLDRFCRNTLHIAWNLFLGQGQAGQGADLMVALGLDVDGLELNLFAQVRQGAAGIGQPLQRKTALPIGNRSQPAACEQCPEAFVEIVGAVNTWRGFVLCQRGVEGDGYAGLAGESGKRGPERPRWNVVTLAC